MIIHHVDRIIKRDGIAATVRVGYRSNEVPQRMILMRKIGVAVISVTKIDHIIRVSPAHHVKHFTVPGAYRVPVSIEPEVLRTGEISAVTYVDHLVKRISAAG